MRLLNLLINNENVMARTTDYNIKYVERSGIALSRLFQRVPVRETCHWPDCPVCLVPDRKKTTPTRSCFQRSNIVYRATCLVCEEELETGRRSEEDVGVYIGESSRTLAERATEHIQGSKLLKEDNYIVKHWVNHHPERLEPPVVRFRVIKSFKDALSRLLAESVWIDTESNLNSKNEWRGEKITRITISGSSSKKDEPTEEEISAEIESLKERIEWAAAGSKNPVGKAPRVVPIVPKLVEACQRLNEDKDQSKQKRRRRCKTETGVELSKHQRSQVV